MQAIENVENRPAGALVFEEVVRLGRRLRILLPFGQTLRPLLFVDPRRDGSIVVGPGKRGGRGVLSAARRRSEEPLPEKLRASLGERRIPNDFHFTFHASGIINNHAGPRTYRAPLIAPGPHRLCRVDFEHPGYLPPVEKRSKDVILQGIFDLSYALQGQVVVIPARSVVFFQNIADQVAFILRVTDAAGATAFSLQLSILRTQQPWPDETNFEWISQDATFHGFEG